MRVATVCALAISMSLAVGAAWAQNDPAKALIAATAAPVASQATCPGNPNPLGVARVVEIDTTGGPGFGSEHFKAYDFLREGEVVLTFDDGPWPGNTPAVLKALAAQCTKALFFPIGKHAMWHPEILRVRPKTSARVTKLSQHEANGGEFQEREGVAVEIFPILGEAAATIEPRNRTFDDPALG